MPNPRLRYAFAITDGPNAGLGCAGWRIWTHRDDTYIAAKGNPWKASLHSDASWRVAVTSEHVTSGKLPIVPGGRATSWEFEPTPFEHGGRMAFAMAVPRNSLIPVQPSSTETIIEVADCWDRLTILYVWMTEAAFTLQATQGFVGGPLQLEGGRQVWVTAREEFVEPYPPEPVPAGQLIEPRWPGEHAVTAPGFMVRGVNIAGGLRT
jgi:hypothetical protein